MLIDTRGRERPRLKLEPAQTSVVVALNAMLEASGLILVCPHCVNDGGSHLQGDVSSQTAVWKLECACTVRVMERKDAMRPFDADGDLMAAANSVLQPVKLMVRCPEPKCVRVPLEMERTDAGLVVRCQCARTTFRTPTPTLQ